MPDVNPVVLVMLPLLIPEAPLAPRPFLIATYYVVVLEAGKHC
jgi:hypothetical protein